MTDANKKFPVIECFGPTIQGEGAVIGMQTMFIRFGGCDYRCTKCDSLHAVLPKEVKANSTYMTTIEICHKLFDIAGHCKTVTFSGGNPCMHDLTALVRYLKQANWTICVETQGTLYHNWLEQCDFVTVSPKGPGMGEKYEEPRLDYFYDMLDDALPYLSFKVVIMDQRDIEFAKHIATRYAGVDLYLSLGNPYPPPPATQDPSRDLQHRTLPQELLARMAIIWEQIKLEPCLTNAKFLPQLHVLLWDNERNR